MIVCPSLWTVRAKPSDGLEANEWQAALYRRSREIDTMINVIMLLLLVMIVDIIYSPVTPWKKDRGDKKEKRLKKAHNLKQPADRMLSQAVHRE